MKTITISFFPLQKQQSLRKEPLENTHSLPKMRLLNTQAPKRRRKCEDGFDFLYRGNNVRVFII